MKNKLIPGILAVVVISGILITWNFDIKPSAKVNVVNYSEDQSELHTFYYSDTLQNEYLRKLRKDYKLQVITNNAASDFEKVKIILNWVNSKWEHSGSNSPKKSDAISILNEVKQGKKFRCVEYGIVCAAALNSLDYKSRVIHLKTKDVETVFLGAGHVAAEVFVPQFNKWVFLDGQCNAIPCLKGIPLNAVEFQKAILSDYNHLEILNLNGPFTVDNKKSYTEFVGKHLFYLDVVFDNRYGINEPMLHEGKKSMMLVPLGEKEPKRFQVLGKIGMIYTHSISDFYQQPSK